MFRYRTVKIATAALAVICGLLSSMPSASATTDVTPVFTTVPAFDHDLPLAGNQISSGTSSSASTATASATYWICTDYAGTPNVSYGAVYGEGHQSCSGSGWTPQEIRVTIQRYLGLGYWASLATTDSGPVFSYYIDEIALYNCSRLGTQTYRTVLDAYVANGTYHQASESGTYLRATC
jgi:hypothetical protein